MVRRCRDPKVAIWPHYGGRGITVCKRWLNFLNFLADMGPRPQGHSLERIDRDSHYEPGNVRWATQAEQVRNTSRTRLITYNGITLCLADWATRLGISDSTLEYRIKHWPLERALTTPTAQRGVHA
jgi:hypothetical protein